MQQQTMGPPPPCRVPMPMLGSPASGALPQGFQVMPPGAIPGMPPGLIQGMARRVSQGGGPNGPVVTQAGPPPNLHMPMPHPPDLALMLPPPLPPSGGGALHMPSSVPHAPLVEALKKVHRPTKRALVAAQRLALAAAAEASLSESDFAPAQPTALAPAVLAAAILAEASPGISPGCSVTQVPNEGMDAVAEAAAVIASAEAAEMAATNNGSLANSSTPHEVASTSAAETEGVATTDNCAAEVSAANGSDAAMGEMGAIGPPHNESGLAPVHFAGMSGAQPLLAIAPDEQYGLRIVGMPSTGELSCLPNGALALKISQSTSLLYLPHSHLTPFAFHPGTATSSASTATTSDAPAAGTMLDQPSHAPAMAAQSAVVAEHDHEMAASVQ